MNRRYIVIAACFFAVFIGPMIVALVVIPLRAGVTKTNFDKIEIGMAFEEVNVILGGRPDNGVTKDDFQMNVAKSVQWRAVDGAVADIRFGFDNNVVRKTWTDSQETAVDRIRRLLGTR